MSGYRVNQALPFDDSRQNLLEPNAGHFVSALERLDRLALPDVYSLESANQSKSRPVL